MKLVDKYRPKYLDEVCGQPEVAKLQGFARNPSPSCWLFESVFVSGNYLPTVP